MSKAIDFTQTATTNAGWQDVDVTALVTSGATGVWGFFDKSGGTTTRWIGWRYNGDPSAALLQILNTNGRKTFFAVGLDANKKFEVYIDNDDVDLYIGGEFGQDATWFTTLKSPTYALTGWIDIDCSAHVPAGAVAVIYGCVSTADDGFGVRAKGSAHTLVGYITRINGGIMTLDANRKFQISRSANTTIYILGYLTDGTFKVDPYLMDTVTTGWQDFDLTPDGPPADDRIGVFWGLGTATYNSNMRQKGSAFNILRPSRQDMFAIALDVNDVVQYNVGTVTLDLYLWGYLAPNKVFVPPPFVSFYPSPDGT